MIMIDIEERVVDDCYGKEERGVDDYDGKEELRVVDYDGWCWKTFVVVEKAMVVVDDEDGNKDENEEG